MKKSTLIVAVTVFTAATLAAVAAVDTWPGPADPAPDLITLKSPQPPRNLAATDAGVIRILAVAAADADAGADGQPALDAAHHLVDVNHLGPLSDEEAAALAARCRNFLELTRQRFAERPTDSTASSDLLAEAVMFYDAALAEAAVDAVDNGSYLVVSQSDPLQLTVAGAELLTTGAMRAGEQVNVSIVVSYEAFPRVREARKYLDDMQFFDDSEKARTFNELGDAERSRLAALVREVESKADRTRSERDFLAATVGFNTSLDTRGNILRALPIR